MLLKHFCLLSTRMGRFLGLAMRFKKSAQAEIRGFMLSLNVDLLAAVCFLSWGLHGLFFSAWPPQLPQPLCVSGPREPRRHTFALGSPSPGFSLELRPQKHMSLIKCSLRHWLVNTQLQENQQRAHSSSATLWLSECVIHYSVIKSLCFSGGPLANSEALGERDEGLCLHFV